MSLYPGISMNQCHWGSCLFTLGYLWIVIESLVSLPWDNLWINVIDDHVSLPWDIYESSLRVMSLYPGIYMNCHWGSCLFTLGYIWINAIDGHCSLPWNIYEGMPLMVIALYPGISMNLWINDIEGHVSLPWDSYESMSLRVMSLYPGLSMNLSLRVMSLYPGISMNQCHWGSCLFTLEYLWLNAIEGHDSLPRSIHVSWLVTPSSNFVVTWLVTCIFYISLHA